MTLNRSEIGKEDERLKSLFAEMTIAQRGARDSLSADSEPKALRQFLADQSLFGDRLSLSPLQTVADDRSKPSRLEQMTLGAVPAELAQLFTWLPALGPATDSEYRLGNAFNGYLNAQSDSARQKWLEALKQEAGAAGPHGLQLLQGALIFDAFMRLQDSSKELAQNKEDAGARNQVRLALADLAALIPSTDDRQRMVLLQLLDRYASTKEKDGTGKDSATAKEVDVTALLRALRTPHDAAQLFAPPQQQLPESIGVPTLVATGDRKKIVLDPLDGGNGGREGRKPGHDDVPDQIQPAGDGKDKLKDGDDKRVIRFSDLPNGKLLQTVLVRMLRGMNATVENENTRIKQENDEARKANAEAPQKPLKPTFDETKLRQEWSRNEFGAESCKLFTAARDFLQQDTLRLLQLLDARGLPFPPGAPVGPAKSESGSGLNETDEMFRSRLRAGLVKVDLRISNLEPGRGPDTGEVERLINAYAWDADAGLAWRNAFIDGQATAIDKALETVTVMTKSGRLDRWKKPKDASTRVLERWSMAASDWSDTAIKVRNYAETIAALNAATTTYGVEWPGLSKICKAIALPGNATTYPDDALKDENFPGRVIRDEKTGGILKIELDLPDSLDRSDANIKKMQRLETWIQKWGPDVDKTCQEITKTMADQDRILMWFEDADFDLTKSLSKFQAEAVRKEKDNAEVGLKGDDSDVGKFINVSGEGKDWRIKSVTADGGYELERVAPNGQEFNLKRYGFTTEPCDEKGNPDPKGEYVKVTGYQDYLWARAYAYNNWNLSPVDLMPGSALVRMTSAGQAIDKYTSAIQPVHRQITMKPQVFHKRDMVPIVDEGRMRLMRAENLGTWSTALETAKQTGNVVNTAVDIGMALEGGIEFRVAFKEALKKGGEYAVRSAIKQGLRAGAWHFFLAGTGFGKQAIVNNVPYGREFMHVRHWLIMADMSLSLTPTKFQEGLWSKIPGYTERAKALEAYKALPMKGSTWYDWALKGAHKLYEGGRALPYTPQIGIFPLCDYYFLYEFGDTASHFLKLGEDHRGKLQEAAFKHRYAKPEDRPLYASPDKITPQQIRKAVQPVLDDYARKLGKEKESNDLLKRAGEMILLDHNDPKRGKFAAEAAATFANDQSSEKDRTAAAVILLTMRETDNPGEVLGENKSVDAAKVIAYLRERATSSGSVDVRMVAGESLFRTCRMTEANLEGQQQILSQLEAKVQGSPDDEKLKQELELAKERVEKTKAFKSAASYSGADFANLCLEVLRNNKATREQKLEAILSPTGPRLALIMDQLKNEIEPALEVDGDGLKRLTGLAGLYGRDASTISKVLKEVAGDEKEDADVRALAAQVLRTSEADRSTINGVPLTPGVELKVGSRATVKVEGDEIKAEHASISLRQDGTMLVRAIAGQTVVSREVGSVPKELAEGEQLYLPGREGKAAQVIGVEKEKDQIKIGGVALKIGKEVKITDGVFAKLAQNGTVQVRDAAGGAEVLQPVGPGWSELNPGDRVFLGSRTSGKELFFGHERLEGWAFLIGKLKLSLDKPGEIAQAYTSRLQAQLEAQTKPSMSAHDRNELLTEKYRAAVTAIELGTLATGGDATHHQRVVADALADCVTRENPVVAAAALLKLTPELVTAMTPEKADKLRGTVLRLMNITATDPSNMVLRLALIDKLPEIASAGTPEQRNRAQGMLESLLIPGASSRLGKKDTTINYPIYPEAQPELRVAALESLAKMNVDRALDVAKVKLVGGTLDGETVSKDVASVRLVALRVLEKGQPLELHEIAMRALRTEGDPAVSASLWNVEYGSRRPELDPVRLMKEYEAIRERVEKRAKPGILEDAKKASSTINPIIHETNFENAAKTALGEETYHYKIEFRKDLGYSVTVVTKEACDFESERAKLARTALIYLASERAKDAWDAGRSIEACEALEKVCAKGGAKLAPELAADIEMLILSSPNLNGKGRAALIRAYMNLKPGENDIVSKEEAAVVLTRALQNELTRMQRNPYESHRSFAGSRDLLDEVTKNLKSLPTDKVVPVLDAMAGKEPVQQLDEQGRPLVINYGMVTRRFEYDDKGLVKITEEPTVSKPQDQTGKVVSTTSSAAKVYLRDPGDKSKFRTKDGEVITNVQIPSQAAKIGVTDRAPGLRNSDSVWASFDAFAVQGDLGDFRYEKDGKRYIQKPNGCQMVEELQDNTRTITITYPGGTTSRKFVFRPSSEGNGKVDVTVSCADEKQSFSLDTTTGAASGDLAQLVVPERDKYLKLEQLKANPDRGSFRISMFQFDRGEFVYMKDGHLHIFDALGRHIDKDGEGKIVITGGKEDPAGHPYVAASVAARDIVNQWRDTTVLARQAAADELRYLKQNPSSEAKFGPNIGAKELADAMVAVLSQPDNDAASVVKALHLGMLSKPLDGATDPRLLVLRIAAIDKNETVRAEASRLLFDSPNSLDRESAVFIAAELAKNSASTGLRQEASEILRQFEKKEPKLVDRARQETPNNPRRSKEMQRQDAPPPEPKDERIFEDIRRRLQDGRQSMTADEFSGFLKRANFGLINDLSGAQYRAIKQFEDNLGGASKFAAAFYSYATYGDSDLYGDEKRSVADKETSKMWSQVDDLVKMSMEKDDNDSEGKAARQALAYIVMNDGKMFKGYYSGVDAKIGVEKAIDGICAICKGNGPGRGDMEWTLRTLLLEKPDLPARYKAKIVDALDALSGDSGKISRENACGIAILALEQDIRFNRCGGDNLEYQKRLLTLIEKFGNRELMAALQVLSENHSDASFKSRCKEVKDSLDKRTNVGVERLVLQMVADTEGKKAFATIKDARDPRVLILLRCAQDKTFPAEQRLRAAEILMDKGNPGVRMEDRKQAAALYCDLGLSLASDQKRYEAIAVAIDRTNPLFTNEQRDRAVIAAHELFVSTKEQETREKSGNLVREFSPDDACVVIKHYAQQARQHMEDVAQSSAKRRRDIQADIDRLTATMGRQKAEAFVNQHMEKYGPEPKIDDRYIGQKLAQITALKSKAVDSPKGQALLMSLYSEATKEFAKEQAFLKDLRESIDKFVENIKTEPLQDANDPRWDGMLKLLEADDERVNLEVALILTASKNKAKEAHQMRGWWNLAKLSTSKNESVRKRAQEQIDSADPKTFGSVLLRSYINVAIDCVSRQDKEQEHRCWENVIKILDKNGEPKDSDLYKQAKLRFAETGSGSSLETAALYEQRAQDELKKSDSGEDRDSRERRACDYWRQSIKFRAASMDKDDPELARARFRCAEFLLLNSGSTRGSYLVAHNEAKRQLEEAVRAFRSKSDKSSEFAQSLMLLAELSSRDRDMKRYQSYLEETWKLGESDNNNVPMELRGECLARLTLHHASNDDYSQARKFVSLLTELAKGDMSDNDRANVIASALNAVSATFRDEASRKAAVSTLELLLAQTEKLSGTSIKAGTWSSLGSALWAAAETLEKDKQYSLADRLYKRSLVAFEQGKDSQHPGLKRIYQDRQKKWAEQVK